MILNEIRTAFEIIGIAVTAGFFTWMTVMIVRAAPKRPPERCPDWADQHRWQETRIEHE